MRRMRRAAALLFALMLALGTLVLPACGVVEDADRQAPVEATWEESDAAEAQQTESTTSAEDDAAEAQQTEQTAAQPDGPNENTAYTSKDDVALYLHVYNHLPPNYVTKDEAEDAGWKTEGLSVDEACPGMSIGGDRFGNREGRLPSARGRTWYECDIDYTGGRSRGAKRLVYSNDGLIYYTEDHYETFEQLY